MENVATLVPNTKVHKHCRITFNQLLTLINYYQQQLIKIRADKKQLMKYIDHYQFDDKEELSPEFLDKVVLYLAKTEEEKEYVDKLSRTVGIEVDN